MSPLITVAIICVLLIIIIYLTYSTVQTTWANGYWYATKDFLSANGLLSSALYVKKDKMTLLLHLPTQIVIQMYKINYPTTGNVVTISPISCQGSCLFDGKVIFDIQDKMLRITSKKDGKIAFKGVKLLDTT